MIRFKRESVRLDRIEAAYLNILRLGVLAVATVCLLAALWFAADGLWRVFVTTDVKEKPFAVSGAEVATALRREPEPSAGRGGTTIPGAVRATHTAFMNGPFAQYYGVYRKTSTSYKKPEDDTLSREELAAALGYDLPTYAAGSSLSTKQFVESPAYQAQLLAAVTGAMAAPEVLGQLREYKAATKSAQSCSTTYERRAVWDTYSMVCEGWWVEPRGCQVMRSVPVERCVAAYPDGIVSPTEAFGRADKAFAELWLSKADQVQQDAATARADREYTRAQIGPRLWLALKIIAGFLVVMFFFLMVAVERHLRRISSDAVADPTEPTLGTEAAMQPQAEG